MSFAPAPSPFNMAHYVLARGETLPDKTALSILSHDTTQDWTYAALRRAILGTATGLLNHGLTSGDRVLLRLGNTPDFPIAFLACIAVGLIPVPTSAQLTAPEITALAKGLAPAAIIAGDGITLPDHPARVISTADLEAFTTLPTAPFDMGDPNRPAYIIYTSGTSGTPRGVVHAHRAIWARRMMHEGWYGLTETDRMMHAGAFNWTYTLGTGLMDPWTMGATALIPSLGTSSPQLPALLAQHSATIFAAAPGVYRQILKSDIPTMPTLRHGLSAGEKLPQVTGDLWRTKTGLPIHEAFGMSECSTFISGNPSNPAPMGTLGRPQHGRKVTLRRADGTKAPTGESGEIAIHRCDPGLMLGYLNAPKDTAGRFQGDWFLTSDVGRVGIDNAIHYQGRVDDMLNAGGYRVSPLEVEAALETHPHIKEAAAVELPLKADTSVIAAFYVSDDVIDEDDARLHCTQHLARYKQPRLLIRIDTLPRGANNKLLRRKLRDNWEAQNGQT